MPNTKSLSDEALTKLPVPAAKVNGELFVAQEEYERHADLLWQAIRKMANVPDGATYQSHPSVMATRDLIAKAIDKGKIECVFGWMVEGEFRPDDETIFTQEARRGMHL